MKDQGNIQISSDKFQSEVLFMGGQMDAINETTSETFKGSESMKPTLSATVQKKVNPRLFIL